MIQYDKNKIIKINVFLLTFLAVNNCIQRINEDNN
jgi:hypothetical protein